MVFANEYAPLNHKAGTHQRKMCKSQLQGEKNAMKLNGKVNNVTCKNVIISSGDCDKYYWYWVITVFFV